MNEELKKFKIPESKLERLRNLEDAILTLKSEFIGLDEILDQIRQSIIPWYVTPEVIDKPTIISLWGMTGTGKTSVIRRLIELLNFSNRSVFFDCGEEAAEFNEKGIVDKISEVVGISYNDSKIDVSSPQSFMLVFDEFQHARTIDEQGLEVKTPTLRAIWNLMDNGILSLKEEKYVDNYVTLVDDLCDFSLRYPNMPVTNGMVTEESDVDLFLREIGLCNYERKVPNIQYEDHEEEEFGEKEKFHGLRPINILSTYQIRVLYRYLNRESKGLGPKVYDEILNCTKIVEIVEILKRVKEIMLKPRYLNCSKSIIFVLGNLDEAFKVSEDVNPDYDADVFYEMTSKVSIMDIKSSLQRRFRPEQIARFGNGIIKYPTLKKEHFRKIVIKELNKIIDNFQKSENISISYSEDIVDLLYSEGVYPVQGVRPVFTTIGTIFTPLLSEIILNKSHSTEVNIKLSKSEDNKVSGFKLSKVGITLEFNNSTTIEKSILLELGQLRNPDNKKTKFITAVHESGHAIISIYRTGKCPQEVVSVSVDGGGYCSTYNSDNFTKIDSRYDIDSDVMISMAGYISEEIIYSDKSKHLMGSGSDIKHAWNTISSAAFECGYFDNVSFSNNSTESYTPTPSGLSSQEVEKKIKDRMEILSVEVRRVLMSEDTLLRKLSLKLGNKGSLRGSEIEEIVLEYGTNLLKDKLNKINTEDYYYEELIKPLNQSPL